MSTSNHILEVDRVGAQERLDAQKSHAERNKLGQFATPSALASDMLKLVKSELPKNLKIRFLDPAFGTGAFYSALLGAFPEKRIESAFGIEIDPHYANHAIEFWKESPLNLQIGDFFDAKLPSKDKPNLIICNPPYVRHHHLSTERKGKLQKLVASAAMTKLNGLAGLYCYFLLYAHAWLEDGGYACWLIPSEFLDVNYGTAVKEYLLSKVTLLRIHRFDAASVQFDDALVSSSILWFRKSVPPANQTVEFSLGGSLTKPEILTTVPASRLRETAKWNRAALSGTTVKEETKVRLGDLFEIKRGLATGANDFFILSPEEIKEHRLPEKFLIPILPSPRYLRQEIVETDERGNPVIDQRLFLLSCSLPESEVKNRYPHLWDYYKIGVERKTDETYICSHRSPWYTQEFRAPAPFLCTYMGRNGGQRESPFRFILNCSKAVVANVYLMLYPKPALNRFIKEAPNSLKNIWEALNKISAESLLSEGRVYGGGLHKLEPKELANASAGELLELLPRLAVNLSEEDYDLFTNTLGASSVREGRRRQKKSRRQNE